MTAVGTLLETVCRSAVDAVFTPPFTTVIDRPLSGRSISILAKYANRSLCMRVSVYPAGNWLAPDGTVVPVFGLSCRRVAANEDARIDVTVTASYRDAGVLNAQSDGVCPGFAARFCALARKVSYSLAAARLE